MKNKLGLMLLVNLYSLTAWSALPDLTVVNTSERLAFQELMQL